MTGFLSLGPVLLNYGPCFPEFRTCFTELWTLPHASCTTRPQNHVSVIISCKTAKTDLVENTVGLLALSQMRSWSQEQLAAGPVGVSDDPFAYMYRGVQPVDTSSF